MTDKKMLNGKMFTDLDLWIDVVYLQYNIHNSSDIIISVDRVLHPYLFVFSFLGLQIVLKPFTVNNLMWRNEHVRMSFVSN